jgi:hypothetical protein
MVTVSTGNHTNRRNGANAGTAAQYSSVTFQMVSALRAKGGTATIGILENAADFIAADRTRRKFTDLNPPGEPE